MSRKNSNIYDKKAKNKNMAKRIRLINSLKKELVDNKKTKKDTVNNNSYESQINSEEDLTR